MALDSGGVRASVLLDLSQFEAQKVTLRQHMAEVGSILEKLPDAKPKINTDPLKDDADKAKKLAQEVADAIGHLTGGRVELDIGQLEKAGADASGILSTLTAGFASSAAAVAVFSAAVVAAALEVEHVLVEMGEHWEAAFRKVAATTGLSGEALEHFEASAVSVGMHSAASTENITAAMQQLSARLQLTGADLEAATSQATKFAKVWGLDAGDAAKSLAQIMTLFHEPATNAGHDLDILTAVAQKTQIPMEQLETQLKSRLGPTLVALGFNFTEAALLLANMAQQGEAGRAAIQALNKILQEAAAAGKDPQVVFAELTEQLKNAGGVGTATGDALATKLGPAFSILSTMAKRGGLDVKESAAEIAASGGQVDAAFGVMRSGAEKVTAQLTILKNQFAPLGIEIAKVVNQLETDLANAIARVTQALQDFDQKRAQLATNLPTLPQEAVGGITLASTLLGPPGIAVAKAAQALGPQAPATPTAEGAHGAEGPAASLKATEVAAVSLAAQLATLQKQMEATSTDAAVIQGWLQQEQTLKAIQAALAELPPSLAGIATAEVNAADAAVRTAEANIKQADSYSAVAQANARAQDDIAKGFEAQAAQAAKDAENARNRLAALAQITGSGIAAAEAEKARTDAIAKTNQAEALAEQATRARANANAVANVSDQKQTEGLAVQGAALDDLRAKQEAKRATDQATIQQAAEYQVQLQRTTTLLADAKPYLDAQAEATIKVAVANKDLGGALDVALTAMGLTRGQIDAVKASLAGGQQQFDQTSNSLKALDTAHKDYASTLGTLASGALPTLTAAQADALKQTVASGDAQKTADAIAATYGVSVDELNAHIAQGTDKLKEWEKQQLAANRALADFVKDEDKSRISSGLLGLAKDVDSVTAAQIKQAQESGNTAKALDLLAGGLGLNSDLLHQWEADLKAGGAAAVAAREQIAELSTLVRNASGVIDIKVNVDIQQVQTQIHDLQQNFQEANATRARGVAELEHTEQLATRDFNRQMDSIQETHNTALRDISTARTASAGQFGSDLAAVASAENKALASIAVTERAAQTTFRDTMTAAQAQHDLTFATATKTYTDGLKAVQDQTAQAIEQVAKAQAAGLSQLSAAMTTFNQQQVQNAFNQSVALQTAQNAANSFTDTQSVASAVRSAQIQAEGAAGLAQQNQATALAQAQHSVAQQQLDATKQLTAVMENAAKQVQALTEAQKNAQIAANVQLQNAGVAAQRALDISGVGADYYNATTTQNKTVVLINGQPYILDSTSMTTLGDRLAEGTLDLKPGGTTGARTDAEKAAQRQIDAAQARFDARTKQLNDQEQAAQRRFEEQTKAALEARAEQVRHFLEQERAQQEAQRKADEQYQRELRKLRVQDATLQAIQDLPADIAKKLHLGPEQINIPGATFQETGVDYVGSMVASLGTHIIGGGGG